MSEIGPGFRLTCKDEVHSIGERPLPLPDSLLEQSGFELVWGFSCQVVFSVYCQFFVRSGKAVLRSLIAPQVSTRFSTPTSESRYWLKLVRGVANGKQSGPRIGIEKGPLTGIGSGLSR